MDLNNKFGKKAGSFRFVHFGQFVQISCRKKEKEENNGNHKAFCVTHKRNK